MSPAVRFSLAALVLAAACVDPNALPADARAPRRAAGTAFTNVPPVSAVGCADGTREGFKDIAANPNTAGCSGGWSIPGINNFAPAIAPACPQIAPTDTRQPACNRQSGNDSANPNGNGCNVADLCAPGWHVCQTTGEVAKLSPKGCAGATQPADPPLFFASRQTSNGCGVCANGERTDSDCNSMSCTIGCAMTPSLSNDLFGCGNFGSTNVWDCGPFDRFSNNVCGAIGAWTGSGWSCYDPAGLCEAYTTTKSGPAYGGVLCCRDCVAPLPDGTMGPDTDCDGVADAVDNCPLTYNPDQKDACHPNQPPDVSHAAASSPCLWPPNHKFAPITITGVTDPDKNDSATIAINYVWQDEPLLANGSGNFTPDGSFNGDTAYVRAERIGTQPQGDGRVYHIGFTATDTHGASSYGEVTVCVPHDQSSKTCSCGDQGAQYDSTAGSPTNR